ncbi:MAG: IPT/TIG domain-containing protein [Flavobacteriaceae bacterium]|jgi:streptogramin lyase|nr:IPT/TIG domain-containing protein [Flavobacteriaceae bacterium]
MKKKTISYLAAVVATALCMSVTSCLEMREAETIEIPINPPFPPIGGSDEISIISFAPAAAQYGETVTITGTGFSATPSENSVTFNNILTTVVSSTSTEIKVTVPQNKECTGLVRVTVAGETAVSDTPFTYLLTYSSTPTLFAGSSTGESGSNDGQGSAARFNIPLQLASDAQGNIYVADSNNKALRKITPTGMVTTVSGYNSRTRGVLVDADENIYVAEENMTHLWKIPASSGTAVSFGNGLFASAQLAKDVQGNIYVVDSENRLIRKIDVSGNTTNVYELPYTQFLYPYGVALDASGNIYASILEGQQIWKISSGSDTAVLFAGRTSGSSGFSDGQGTDASFYYPYGMTTDAVGNIYVADGANRAVRKITPGGMVSTLFTTGPGIGTILMSGITFDPSGNMYVSTCNDNTILKIEAK